MLLSRMSRTILPVHANTNQSLRLVRKGQHLKSKYKKNLVQRRYAHGDEEDEELDLEEIVMNTRDDYPAVPIEEVDFDEFGVFNELEIVSAPFKNPGGYLIDASTNFDDVFTPESVGKYFEITPEETARYMKDGWAGHLEKKEFKATNRTCFMIRKETIDAVNWLNKSKDAMFTNEAPPPMLLSGERGVGKSAILNSLVYYARKTGWIVFYVPYGENWVHGGDFIRPSRVYEGLWDQPKLARRFLENMLDIHGDQLAQIPVRNPTTQISSFEGNTLYDLVEFGVTLPEHSGTVGILLRHELTRTHEFPVLIAVDSYNTLFNYNQEFRNPDSDGYVKRKLRNYELTMTKILENAHIDPVLVNGTFIGSLSTQATFRHFDKADLYEDQILEVQPYNRDECVKALLHYQNVGFTKTPLTEATEDIIWRLTDGRGSELVRYATML
eukprot:TRINITY_DN11605_c0_g1_i1.p1 TRINITY_DN11605_c0_g1~~TRINITY_DN11605_c0_g1_i1.p1  ORF type:complete len:452 (+),score=108.05 TRINITY_DN11605_c0_g1_i1:34-1356(+)